MTGVKDSEVDRFIRLLKEHVRVKMRTLVFFQSAEFFVSFCVLVSYFYLFD